MMPSVGRQDLLVFKPVRPQNAAGKRTEPPVSVPVAQTLSPAATATPDPADDPPGTRGWPKSHGFKGVPIRWLVPHPPKAHSTVLVLPTKIPPAAIKRRTIGPLWGDTRSCMAREPQVVTRFSTSKISFKAKGIPWNGPILCPDSIAASAALAADSASSA